MLVALLALSACGHHADPRAALATYIGAVDKVESALATPLRSVSRVGPKLSASARRGSSIGTVTKSLEAGTLARDEGQIKSLRGQLAAIKAPAAAQRLRSLLLQLVDRQLELTNELSGLAAFLPRFSAALVPLGPASTELNRAMARRQGLGPAGVAAVYSAKAAALRRFEAVIGSVLGTLHTIHAPPVSAPSHSAQVQALTRMKRDAGQLAIALGAGGGSRVPGLLADFDQALALGRSLPVQRAEIAAAKAYDARIASLNALVRQIQLEQRSLARTVR